jgi:Asp-tRNA(Asn)/Glu-tRNA(Gln) amidotransferase A subunit family amidase
MTKRGAVLVGKTETTAFAYRTPPPTRNPRDLAHTPMAEAFQTTFATQFTMTPVILVNAGPRVAAGLQLTAAHGQDARLLQTAVSLERRLSSAD